MDHQPLVSVIMPAYNCEKYIAQAIESVKQQTYQNWELVIIEDCSTDETWKLVQTFENEKIRIYRNKSNQGVAKTRNHGVKLAKGDWIAFLDSDDLWIANKLEKQVCFLNQNINARLIFTASAFITETGKRLSYVLHVPVQIEKKDILGQNIISCSSVLVEKKLLQKYPMPAVPLIHEDFAVWLQIIDEIHFAYGINEPLLIYRVSTSSKSGNKVKAAKMNWNTYCFIKLSIKDKVKYMVLYILNGMKKYRKIGAEML